MKCAHSYNEDQPNCSHKLGVEGCAAADNEQFIYLTFNFILLYTSAVWLNCEFYTLCARASGKVAAARRGTCAFNLYTYNNNAHVHISFHIKHYSLIINTKCTYVHCTYTECALSMSHRYQKKNFLQLFHAYVNKQQVYYEPQNNADVECNYTIFIQQCLSSETQPHRDKTKAFLVDL